MIERVTMLVDFRCLKAGEVFEFRPGVNLLVGDQGTGKSSLLRAITDAARFEKLHSSRRVAIKCRDDIKEPFAWFDYERMNPRVGLRAETAAEVALVFMSHGECAGAIFRSLEHDRARIIFADEPDMALSPRSQYGLAARMRVWAASGRQIIASVHSIPVIESVSEVLSMEHRRWVPSAEFLADHRRTSPEST